MKNTETEKKLAYMITAYISPESLRSLMISLSDSDVDIYVHIDKKVDITPFFSVTEDIKNVTFLPEEMRVPVYWGGYSQVTMQYNLLKTILKRNIRYDRIISLTGMDYPIASNRVLREAFSDQEKEYIIGFDIGRENWDKSSPLKMSNKDRFLYYYRFDGNWNLARIIKKLRIRRFKSYGSIGYDLYYGSEYWALTYDCIRELIQAYEEDDRLIQLLKHSFVPSESWIHTLFFNSSFRNKGIVWNGDVDWGIGNYSPLSYFKYGKKIKILDETDYDAVISSGRPFARKLEDGVSDALKEKLEAYKKSGSSIEKDLRYFNETFKKSRNYNPGKDRHI